MSRPKFLDDDAFRCLRSGDLQGFARRIAERPQIDFSNADFRGTDFRNVDLAKVVLKGAYLKDADLRGVDLRHMNLEGCSIHNAQIGGAYFPDNLAPAEIEMSVHYGTRLRTRPIGT